MGRRQDICGLRAAIQQKLEERTLMLLMVLVLLEGNAWEWHQA
jgi:hypothetical protein